MNKREDMKTYKLFLIMILVAISFTNAQQNYNFKKFAESEKLSNTQVNDFFQDSFGFMWIATKDGLNRCDGKSVKIYKNIQGDDESLPDNDVFQVIEESAVPLFPSGESPKHCHL